MSEANKVANETWRSDAEQYNIIDLNGIFDCVRVGRNPVENLDERNQDKILSAERILSTELKFLARRLLSIAVTFEHDQHNLPRLKRWAYEKFGQPDYSREVPGKWGFLMFAKDDITATLSFSSSKIVLRAYHRILQHAEYMVLNSLEQQIFSPPFKFVGADGFLKLDHGSYAKTLNFFP